MSKTHDFAECLEASHRHQDAPWWSEVYLQAFPAFQSMTNVRKDGWAQRGGIDRVIVLSSGRTVTIDEKVREKDYSDICLEYWSDEAGRKRGWVAKDLACDFIAYAIAPSRVCYLLPFLPLRAAWKAQHHTWVKMFPRIEARNRNYLTVSVAVPPDVLMEALQQAMTIRWQQAA